jgi:hypothetical protein
MLAVINATAMDIITVRIMAAAPHSALNIIGRRFRPTCILAANTGVCWVCERL